jgi:hypothetical protein
MGQPRSGLSSKLTPSSIPGRSTARTAQLTGKHPTEPNPEKVDLNGARNPVELFFNKIEQYRRVAIATSN